MRRDKRQKINQLSSISDAAWLVQPRPKSQTGSGPWKTQPWFPGGA